MEVFKLYCPVCKSLMKDLVCLSDDGYEFPEKQCPKCLTIYQLASENQLGAHKPTEVILIPHSKVWLKEYGNKYIKGALENSW